MDLSSALDAAALSFGKVSSSLQDSSNEQELNSKLDEKHRNVINLKNDAEMKKMKRNAEEWMSIEHVMGMDSETDYSSDENDDGNLEALKSEQRDMMREIVNGFPKELLVSNKDDGLNDENDEFYDPDEDDENEKWLIKTMREMNLEKDSLKLDEKNMNSDATLSCPKCFTLLCLESQQHETYEHQYRAIFVKNCNTDEKKTMNVEGDEYNPVYCIKCNTQVGVRDNEEIYEFFHVVPSLPPKGS